MINANNSKQDLELPCVGRNYIDKNSKKEVLVRELVLSARTTRFLVCYRYVEDAWDAPTLARTVLDFCDNFDLVPELGN